MDDPQFGVKATVIDLGLSRMETRDDRESKTYWTPFDEEIFEGEGQYVNPTRTCTLLMLEAGDYQFDIYRMMKEYNGHSWEDYRPFTNVMVRSVFALVVSYTHPEVSVASLPHTEAITFKTTEAPWHEKENHS